VSRQRSEKLLQLRHIIGEVKAFSTATAALYDASPIPGPVLPIVVCERLALNRMHPENALPSTEEMAAVWRVTPPRRYRVWRPVST